MPASTRNAMLEHVQAVRDALEHEVATLQRTIKRARSARAGSGADAGARAHSATGTEDEGDGTE